MKISDLSSAKIRGIMLLFFISICIKDDDFKIWKERNDIFILMLLNEIICTALKRNCKGEKGNGERGKLYKIKWGSLLLYWFYI